VRCQAAGRKHLVVGKLDNALISLIQRFELFTGAFQTDNPAISAGVYEMKHVGLAASQGHLKFGLTMGDRIYICSAI
jgi:hypothetical protein